MDILLKNKIIDLHETLKRLLPIKKEYEQKLEEKFRLEFNYNSNHLEGNTLTYGETKLLLFFGKTENNHTLREYEEMEAHDVAFALIKEWAFDKDQPLTEASIKNINKIILVKPFLKDAITPDGQETQKLIKVGDYKDQPNHVLLPNGKLFEYTSPSETPIKMGELMDWYRTEEDKGILHPVELAAIFHYKFVRIHPFDDGNGRISRLLMNYVLLRNELQPVIVRSADKKNYLTALQKADAGDIEAFINYIGDQLTWSLEISIKAAKGEDIDEPGDLDKRLAVLKKKWGEEISEKIIQKKDINSIRSIIENSIHPLAIAWESKLREFDPFFFNRKVHIIFDGQDTPGNNFETALPAAYSLVIYPNLEKNILFNNVKLICQPIGVRKIRKDISLNGGEINFFFFEHTYEVTFSDNKEAINKLYHQQLTEKEINLIVESLGLSLLNALEYTLGTKK